MNIVKKREPLVTVVTATYNHFEHLYETIDSLLSQTYESIEYLICDDGSEHFPEKEIRDYIQEKRPNNLTSFKILLSSENQGTVKNLNRAYKQANGEFIVNLSCGDVFYSQYVLSKISERFLKTNAKVIVTTRVLYKDDFRPVAFLPHIREQTTLQKLDTPGKQYQAFITMMYCDMASGSAMSFRAETIKAYGYFNEEYCLWEDGPFLSRYLINNKLEFAYDIISIWYEEGGMSTMGRAGRPLALEKDILRFEETDRIRYKHQLNRKVRRMISFNTSRIKAKSGMDRIKIVFQYPFQVLMYYCYKLWRRYALAYDRKHMEEYLKKHKFK